MKILYKTISGSRLYGLDHAESDYDYYTVVDKVKTNKAKYATHKVEGNQDNTVVDFGTWINLCQKGVPQALESMFSQKAIIDEITEFRAGFRAGTNYESYRGMMKSMAMEFDDFKHRRHIIRLGANMASLKKYNRFDPTLSARQIREINFLAERQSMEQCYEFSKALANALD